MGLLQAVQADPDIGKTGLLDPFGHGSIDQGPIGGDYRPYPQGGSVLAEFEEILPQ
jgi:hypothetical protein